jgi:hypothetical protein
VQYLGVLPVAVSPSHACVFRKQTELLRSGQSVGVLAGIPLAVKDLEDVAGLPTSYGCNLYVNNIAAHDSVQVSRLRSQGKATLFFRETMHRPTLSCHHLLPGPAFNSFYLASRGDCVRENQHSNLRCPPPISPIDLHLQFIPPICI